MSDKTEAEMLNRAQDISCKISDGKGGVLYRYGHCLCAGNVRELLGKKTVVVNNYVVTLPDPDSAKGRHGHTDEFDDECQQCSSV